MTMTEATRKETHSFQAEVKQILKLVVHSLYSHKEIFLRELVSNASDAIDKLRFESLTNSEIASDLSDLAIHVEFDSEQRTLTISDNGIGMNRQEVIDNLGTIARSGTREFIERLSSGDAKSSNLIGQFGVGFYSAYIISDSVVVETRRAGASASEAIRWESNAEGEYTLEPISKDEVGTAITLHLKEGEDEFLNDSRLRNIIHKYSDHIAVPILMPKPPVAKDENEGEEASDSKPTEIEAVSYETVNRAKAIWTLPKDQIEDNDYKELYKHISHDFEDPWTWAHNKVEGKLEYTTLLYIPSRRPFDLWNRDANRGLKLYVKRVFIMDDADQFLPLYLRFVKGIVDSDDLPLNVSREILQSNHVVEKIKASIINRILNSLEKLVKDKPDVYSKFWNTFGTVLKEGPAEDFNNKERIAKLLRFNTTHADGADVYQSLEDYVARMREGQDKIYYLTANSYEACKNSPYLEIFRQKGIEVMLMSEQVDEWLMSHLTEFDGKPFQSITRGDLELGDLEDETEKAARQEEAKTHQDLVEKIKSTLGERVKDVRVTHRLTSSPACIVADDDDLSGHMQRLLEAAGQNIPAAKPIFEINPNHGLIKRLDGMGDNGSFNEWVDILFEQSVLAEGGQLDDPAGFVTKLNRLLADIVD